jgi:hypothetical protein
MEGDHRWQSSSNRALRTTCSAPLVLPAGSHKVEMKFEPQSYFTGEKVAFASSSLLLLLFAELCLWSSERKRKLSQCKYDLLLMETDRHMKRVLIITYYWVPAGGVAVQRFLKFTKYLRDYGWEPVILTEENGSYPYTDESLQKQVPEGIEVHRTRTFEPFELYNLLRGQKGKQYPSP